MDVVVDLDVEGGVPGGDGGGEVDPGLGRQLVVALHMVEAHEVPRLRILHVDGAVQRTAGRRAVPDHEPHHDPLLLLQPPQLVPSGNPGVPERVPALLAAEGRVDAHHDERLREALGRHGRAEAAVPLGALHGQLHLQRRHRLVKGLDCLVSS